MDVTEKARTCKHSTGRVEIFAVYVKPTCPHMSLIRGKAVSSKTRCRECTAWKKAKR
mgnify:CR=1 FL=1